ncbi:MAG: L-rhamnose mutarotase, partial [Chitinophagaceae bacterium]
NNPGMKRFCFALDLVDDPDLIAEYEHWHRPGNAWPENIEGIRNSGITNMEIYRTGNRLFMIMDTTDDFSFEKKAGLDSANPGLQDWEKLMGKFQRPLPWAGEGEKWLKMDAIFELRDHPAKTV